MPSSSGAVNPDAMLSLSLNVPLVKMRIFTQPCGVLQWFISDEETQITGLPSFEKAFILSAEALFRKILKANAGINELIPGVFVYNLSMYGIRVIAVGLFTKSFGAMFGVRSVQAGNNRPFLCIFSIA